MGRIKESDIETKADQYARKAREIRWCINYLEEHAGSRKDVQYSVKMLEHAASMFEREARQ